MKGWVSAAPLEKYSSLHQMSLGPLIGWKWAWPKKQFLVQLNANLHAPLERHPNALLIFHTQDISKEAGEDCCFSIGTINRWRANVSYFQTFDSYLASLSRWHRCNYNKTKKMFLGYGCEVRCLDDWIHLADQAYALYANVAAKKKYKLYDQQFFRKAAERGDYKLLSAWFQDQMIGMFLIQDESPSLHSGCAGFDYNHSTKSYAYSWLHYEMIKYAILHNFQFVDAGLTADSSKQMIGFEKIPSRMDIYSNAFIIHNLLRLVRAFIKITLAEDTSLKLGLGTIWKRKKKAVVTEPSV